MQYVGNRMAVCNITFTALHSDTGSKRNILVLLEWPEEFIPSFPEEHSVSK